MSALRSLALLLLAVPTLASADLSLGARVGYAFPSGDAYEVRDFGTFSQKEFADAMVPIQVDLGWNFLPTLTAGVYYSYGFGATGSKLKDLCSGPGASCDAPVFQRFGALVSMRLDALAFLPWASLGAGMELASFKVKNVILNPLAPIAGDLEGNFRGWNANLAAGVDFRLLPLLKVGPYAQWDVGQYTVQDVKYLGETVASGGVDNQKTHHWFTIGLRGTFDL